MPLHAYETTTLSRQYQAAPFYCSVCNLIVRPDYAKASAGESNTCFLKELMQR